MKQMKIALVAMLAIVMGTSFTSCLNSNSGDGYDGVATVTVTESMMGTTLLLTDDGYTLRPSNPQTLPTYTSTKKYVERCVISYLWAEGVEFDADRSKTYDVSIVYVHSVYPIRNYCNQKDTIEHDYPIYEISQAWGANGNYLTAGWKFNYTIKAETVMFELYPLAVEDNVLTLRLRQSLGSEGGANLSDLVFMSFTMPTVDDVNAILDTNLEATNDSVLVKLAYRRSSSSEDLTYTEAMKVKIK